MVGVYLAEILNSFLGKNWKSFAGQNYFDSQGLFLSVMWSGPLLVIAMIILVSITFATLLSQTIYDRIEKYQNWLEASWLYADKHTPFLVLHDCSVEKSWAQTPGKASSQQAGVVCFSGWSDIDDYAWVSLYYTFITAMYFQVRWS